MMKSSFISCLCLTAIRSASAFSSSSPELLPIEIDSEKAFAESKFPIAPDDLIARAKEVLAPEVSIGTKDGGTCLAGDFQFCAAVVGPLPKEEYLNALGTFQLENSFDIQRNAFGFTVSPVQTNRVYWFDNAVATMTAPFFGADPSDVKEDLVFPPQVFHMDFNEEGKVTEFGFYTADRQYGNTGGLGGAFGFFYGVGKPLPFPEAKPYKPSFRFRMLQFIGNLRRGRNKKSE
jgi:hypothetical protein